MQYYFIPLKYNSHKINSTYKDENTEFFFSIYFQGTGFKHTGFSSCGT